MCATGAGRTPDPAPPPTGPARGAFARADLPRGEREYGTESGSGASSEPVLSSPHIE